MTRLLLTSNPAVGHTLPLTALARAAHAAGDQVAIMTAGAMAPLVAPLPVLAVGPDWAQLCAENARRHPGGMGSEPGPVALTPADVGDFFTRTRLALAAEDAERVAREFAPDVIVAEAADALGPFLAAALGVPWAAHGFGTAVPTEFADAMRAAAEDAHHRRGTAPVERIAYVDPWPDCLHAAGWAAPADRITLDVNGTGATEPPRRPRVLVTFGTIVHAPDALATVARALLAETDAALVLTRGALPEVGVRDPRVTEVGFTPYAELLAGTSAVVAAGGAGTTLGALAAGIPLVFLPFFPDHHWQGERVAELGAGVVLADATEAGAAVGTVLSDPRYRRAAATVAAQIAGLGTPAAAWEALRGQV